MHYTKEQRDAVIAKARAEKSDVSWLFASILAASCDEAEMARDALHAERDALRALVQKLDRLVEAYDKYKESTELELSAVRAERNALAKTANDLEAERNENARLWQEVRAERDALAAKVNDLEATSPDSACCNGHTPISFWSQSDGGADRRCPVCALQAQITAATSPEGVDRALNTAENNILIDTRNPGDVERMRECLTAALSGGKP